MVICSLLDIATVTITDKLLEEMGVLKYAYDLNRATVYHSKSEKVWKTLHPRWDRELLSYLYGTTDEGTLYKRQKYLENGLDAIFNTKDEKISSSVIQTIYDITTTSIEGSRGIISIDIVENVMENRMPDYLDNDTKCDLYALSIATAYIELERYNEALDKCDRALEINPNYAGALYNKGLSL